MSKSEKKSARLNWLFTSKELFNMSVCLRSLLVHIKELSDLKFFFTSLLTANAHPLHLQRGFGHLKWAYKDKTGVNYECAKMTDVSTPLKLQWLFVCHQWLSVCWGIGWVNNLLLTTQLTTGRTLLMWCCNPHKKPLNWSFLWTK